MGRRWWRGGAARIRCWPLSLCEAVGAPSTGWTRASRPHGAIAVGRGLRWLPPLAEGPGAVAGATQAGGSIAPGADLFPRFDLSAPWFESCAGGRDQDRPASGSCAGRTADGDGRFCMRRPRAGSPLRRGISGGPVAGAAAWTSHRRGFGGLRASNPNAAAGPPGRGLAVSLHGNGRSSRAQRGSQRRTARTMSGTSIRSGSPR